MSKIFVIAEAGDNHNGNFELALQLVDKAVEAGADCVKFQTFVTEEMMSATAQKADYQKEQTDSDENQFDMVKKLELSFDDFRKIQAYCDKKGIMFLSTPFDILSVEFLNSIGIPFWKIPSGEINNLPYLIQIAKTGKDVILSTGMSTVEEIAEAIKVLKEHGAGKITLLHCNTEYPTPFEDVNLLAMKSLKEQFQVEVGYSDHTLGIEVAIAAAAMGASVIEKHFTLDKTMEGPDHQASLEPDELKQMIQSIRNIEASMGDGYKKPSNSERKNTVIARKSIVARRPIAVGEVFTEENLAIKRPGDGMSPMRWFDVIGKTATKNYEKDEQITL